MAGKKGINRGGKADTPILPSSLISGVVSQAPASGQDKGNLVLNRLESFFNKSLKDVRSAANTKSATRLLARVHGDTAAAVAAQVRLAHTPLKIVAYDAKHQLSDVGTALVRSIVARFDNLYDYNYGYDDRMTLDGVTETCLREVVMSGACALEMVLDDARLPYRLLPVSCNDSQLKWRVGKTKIGKDLNKIIPVQTLRGTEVELDVPTFFYASLDQDPEHAYSSSPLEPAVNTAPFHAEVFEDVRRVVRQTGHSRLHVKLLTEQLRAAAPADVKTDPEKLANWMDSVRTEVESQLESLSPETALVYFDTIQADVLASKIGHTADYTPLIETLDGLLSTSLRTPPSVIGKRMGGSQNVSSTESLLFIKTASGLQPPVAAVLSRALTLAVRLFGFAGYVKVEFSTINLRPEEELEGFKSMAQARILEALSLGFLTDQEAAEILGYGPRAPGAPPLSGTMFYDAKPQDNSTPNDNPIQKGVTGNRAPKSAGGKDNEGR